MQPAIHHPTEHELPRVLTYSVAITAGVVVALAVQISLSRMGIELAGVWRALFSTQALQLRSAGAWWLIAGSAFLAGAVTAWILARFPPPWYGLRALRWLAAGLIVFVLADIGHSAAAAVERVPAAHVVASLVALCAAALMAAVGAYFTGRR
jgi:hypothetical protein